MSEMDYSLLKKVPECLRDKRIKGRVSRLYHAGAPLEELLAWPRVAIVGSRKPSTYGRQLTQKFASELAAQGVVIVSGLAFGIDSLAHRAALEVNGLTLSVLPAGLDQIVPTSHVGLAERIIAEGGALVSDYPPGTIAYPQNFVARNRIIAGLSDIVLIPEATVDSGSLYTADFAEALEKPLLVIPGNIDSPTSVGTNNLLLKGYARAVTTPEDVLVMLGIEAEKARRTNVRGSNPAEQGIIDLIRAGVHAEHELLEQSGLDISMFNQTLATLEIDGKIQVTNDGKWLLT